MVSWQAPVPEQAPGQPANVEPAAGVAVSVTTVPAGKLAPQVVPQLRPAGEDVTPPRPVPPRVSVSGYESGLSAKLAVAATAAFIVAWQVPTPAQAPVQPEN